MLRIVGYCVNVLNEPLIVETAHEIRNSTETKMIQCVYKKSSWSWHVLIKEHNSYRNKWWLVG
jgi:hypothetical protein